MAGWSLGGMVTDIFQVGKDVFLQREATQAEIDRQGAIIQGQKLLQESATQQTLAESKSRTTGMMYLGFGLVAIALFVGLYKSL